MYYYIHNIHSPGPYKRLLYIARPKLIHTNSTHTIHIYISVCGHMPRTRTRRRTQSIFATFPPTKFPHLPKSTMCIYICVCVCIAVERCMLLISSCRISCCCPMKKSERKWSTINLHSSHSAKDHKGRTTNGRLVAMRKKWSEGIIGHTRTHIYIYTH